MSLIGLIKYHYVGVTVSKDKTQSTPLLLRFVALYLGISQGMRRGGWSSARELHMRNLCKYLTTDIRVLSMQMKTHIPLPSLHSKMSPFVLFSLSLEDLHPVNPFLATPLLALDATVPAFCLARDSVRLP